MPGRGSTSSRLHMLDGDHFFIHEKWQTREVCSVILDNFHSVLLRSFTIGYMAPGVRPSIGSLTVTTVPSPHLLSTLILPPCKSTQRLTITSPRPVPGRSWTLCPRWKGVKSHSRSASG